MNAVSFHMPDMTVLLIIQGNLTYYFVAIYIHGPDINPEQFFLPSRSLSSGGSYADEGIYIERRSTPSSRGGSGTQSSGKLSHDSGLEEVPEPFPYQSPSKEQLESSGPIPEHIVS